MKYDNCPFGKIKHRQVDSDAINKIGVTESVLICNGDSEDCIGYNNEDCTFYEAVRK